MSKPIIQLNEESVKSELKELVRNSVEETLNELLNKEAEELTSAAKYERTEARQGYRSGHYSRKLTTTSGEVRLEIPKLKGVPFETAIIERYRRRESSVEEALIEMYLAGVSVRRVEDISEALWGSRVSASTISDLNQKAYVHIEEWRNRKLSGKYPYVYVDGIYLKRNWGGEFENVSILVAIGVDKDGYREIIGAIRWLPMCAEVDGYIANLDLFRQYNVPVPTNYSEFVEAIRLFEEQGIHGYINDYARDYSCLEALQGCAIPELMTLDGIVWRSKYESEAPGEQVGLDDKVWPQAFRKLEQYLKDTYVKPEDYNVDSSISKPAFMEGRLAIMRGTGSDCTVLNQSSGMNCVMLPYFGETAEDNWLLTYPTFRVAVNNDVQKDDAKTEAVMKVLEAMFSEEGQRAASVNSAVLSYNKNVDMDLGVAYSRVMDCISSNRLYIRLASTEIFSVSLNVVQKMIRGEYDARGAYEDFNAQITAVSDNSHPEVITTQKTAYEYEIGEHGSPAASAVVNTLRKEFGSDVAIGYSSIITAPVFKGDYTDRQLNWLVANRVQHRRGTLTGAELKTLMQWLVDSKPDGSNPIRHSNLLPVTGGMEYTLTEGENGTYTLKDLTINGESLDENAEYSVIMLGDSSFIIADYLCNCPMPRELDEKMELTKENVGAHLIAALSGGKQLEAPTDYLTFRH